VEGEFDEADQIRIQPSSNKVNLKVSSNKPNDELKKRDKRRERWGKEREKGWRTWSGMIVKMAVFHNGGGRLLILPPVATSNSEKASWNILSYKTRRLMREKEEDQILDWSLRQRCLLTMEAAHYGENRILSRVCVWVGRRKVSILQQSQSFWWFWKCKKVFWSVKRERVDEWLFVTLLARIRKWD
jgi:hypothetical protein